MKWLLNSTMIWGAILGWFIVTCVSGLVRTANHKGPVWVTYGDGERGPEVREKVSESQYKWHYYETNGLLLVLAVSLWCIVARAERERKQPQRHDHD